MKKSLKKSLKDKFKVQIKRTSQESIPFLQIDEKTGIIEVEKGKFSKSYRIQDINYTAAKENEQQEMFMKYLALLRSFDPEVEIQISINNKNINKESLKRDILLRQTGDELDLYRQEYNEIIENKLKEGKNNIVKEKYLTISILAEDLLKAIKKFSRLETKFEANVKGIANSRADALSAAERLEILHNLYNKDSEVEFLTETRINGKEVKSFDFESLFRRGLTTKDVIAPNVIEFKPSYIRIGDRYARALYLSNISSIMTDEYLNKITDIDFNTITSLNLVQMDKSKSVKLVKNQITNINSNLIEKQKGAGKGGYSYELVSPSLQQAKQEAMELFNDLTTRDQNIYLMTMVIVHFADSYDELERQTNLLLNMSASDSCQLKILRTQQELAFNSALPLANNQLQINRSLTTECVGIFMPFNSQELSQKNGSYYGLNQVSKNIVIYDRKTGNNYNGFILGSSGMGKSFAAKREMFNVLLSRDADVIVIDPEDEYSAMCKMLGGTNIEISTNAQNFINPLDVDLMYADCDDDGKPIGNPINAKSDFILSLCSTVLGGKYGLTPVQNSIIDRCVHNIYKPYEASNYENKDLLPTLKDLYQELMNQCQTDPDAYNVAKALEMYAIGSLDIFAHKTSDSLKVKNKFIVYNILGANGVLKTISMLIILDSIWNRICHNRKIGRETYFYIDEAHLLFKNQETVDYLLAIYKRCRKYDAGCTCITQNITDITKNEDTSAMLKNSSFLMLLGQSPLDIPMLAELLNISDAQKGYISNAEQGSGLLIINGGSIIPIMDKFPKGNHLFKVMTTKNSDLKRIEEEEKADKVHNINHMEDE